MLEHFNLNKLWEDICNLVIRPPRQKYNPQTQLGPKRFKMRNHSGREYERVDFTVKNSRGLQLQCSHYKPVLEQRQSVAMPCVIYLHGNCGSRCDALDAVNLLISHNITVVSLDFAGAGLSEGDYISLGYHERDDVDHVIQKLKADQTSTEKISKIALWGRSAGAATSIMYASEHQEDIVGVVADSPFTSLEDLIFDLVLREQSWVPRSAINLGITLMSKSISKRAKFDIRHVHPLKHAKKANVPILLAGAYGDDFIKIRHAEMIYHHYAGEKEIVRFEGDHNSARPPAFYESVISFFRNILIAQTSLEAPAPQLPIEAPTIHCIEEGNQTLPTLPALASPSSSSTSASTTTTTTTTTTQNDEKFHPIVSAVQRNFAKPCNVVFHDMASKTDVPISSA